MKLKIAIATFLLSFVVFVPHAFAYTVVGTLSPLVLTQGTATTSIDVGPTSSAGSFTNLVMAQSGDAQLDVMGDPVAYAEIHGCASQIWNLKGNGGSNIYPQDLYHVTSGSPIGDFYAILCSYNISGGDFTNISVFPRPLHYINGNWYDDTGPIPDTSTHFISLTPPNASTTATTTNLGADVFANNNDFPQPGRLHISAIQDGAFACENSGAVIDAIQNCSGENSPASPFTIDFYATADQLLAGEYDLSTTTTFTGGGKWNIEYDIQVGSRPWYFLGLVQTFSTIISTTTQITIGQLSPIDVVRANIASSTARVTNLTNGGIGAILGSTTASLAGACVPVSFSFNVGDCLTLLIYPGDQAIGDDFTIIKELPPWGYVFRFIDIINSPISSSSLPVIDYTFATSSPMSVIGDIQFDPFGSIAQSGALIDSMVSDRANPENVWQIFQPVIQIIVYLTLFGMILHDLTGIYNHDRHNKEK